MRNETKALFGCSNRPWTRLVGLAALGWLGVGALACVDARAPVSQPVEAAAVIESGSPAATPEAARPGRARTNTPTPGPAATAANTNGNTASNTTSPSRTPATPTTTEPAVITPPPTVGEPLIDPSATSPAPGSDGTPSGSHGLPAPTGTLPGDGAAAPLFGGWTTPAAPEAWAVQSLGAFPTELPLAPAAITPTAVHPAWTTGHRLALHGDSLLVCVPETGALVELARETGKVIRSIAVGGRPEQVVVAADGTAYVTMRQSGTVARIAPGAASVSASVPVGTEPFGLAMSIDGSHLFVSVSGDDALVLLSVPALEVLGSVPVGFRPRSVAVGLDGEVLVSNERGTATVVEATGASAPIALRTLNPGDLTIHSKLQPNIPGIANRAFGIAIHPVHGAAFFPHLVTRTGTPESESKKLNPPSAPTGSVCTPPTFCPNPGGYGSVTCNPVCEKVDLVFPRTRRPIEWSVSTLPKATKSMQAAMSALPILHGASGEPMTAACDKPVDAIHHPAKSLLFVVCEGTDNVMVLNTAAADPMTAVLGEIRVGAAPRAIVLTADGSTAYVANAQSFTIGRVDVDAFANALVKTDRPSAKSDTFFPPTFAKGTTVAPVTAAMVQETAYALDPISDASERVGRRAYTFARFSGLSANGFFTCATCHIEGADDGLTWFVVDGPRQTPMLAQRLAGTAPFNWIGTAATLPENIHNTVNRMGGAGLAPGVAEGITAYLLGANGPVAAPNKHVAATGLNATQKAGQALFFDPAVGCSTCHTGTALTDGKTWDVGTFSALELELRKKNGSTAPLALNTPSLRGLYNSAPYLHDGSAATLQDVLASTETTMGHSFMLTKAQRDQLAAYLLTL